MLMRCPARDFLGYPAKLATMIALQQVLDQHSSLSGTYTVITPTYVYTNGILKALRDTSDTESKQVQNAYTWDFEFPLITLVEAQQAQNSLMSQLTAGSQVSSPPSWSGIPPTVGAPNSLGIVGTIPAAGALPASTIAPAGG